MTAFKSDFLNILQQRGFIHQCSDFDGLDVLAAKGEATERTADNNYQALKDHSVGTGRNSSKWFV